MVCCCYFSLARLTEHKRLGQSSVPEENLNKNIFTSHRDFVVDRSVLMLLF